MSVSSRVYAKSLYPLLAEDFQYTGKGVKVLLFDSGIGSNIGLGERLKNLSLFQGLREECTEGNFHGMRVASICSEGTDCLACDVEPLGIAPEAEILSAHYKGLYPGEYSDFIEKVVHSFGRVDIIGHPYSCPEDHYLRHIGRWDLTKLSSSEDSGHKILNIAAVGHEGEGNIRFPASCESVLSVGVYDSALKPSYYCGRSGTSRKPELLVPDCNFFAREEDGSLGTLSGTSAAVAIVAGLAAIWAQMLRQLGYGDTPSLIKASLLATSEPSQLRGHRIACLPLVQPEVNFNAKVVRISRGELIAVSLASLQMGTIRICAIACEESKSKLWIDSPSNIQAEISHANRKEIEESDGWVLIQKDLEKNEMLSLNIRVSGPARNVAISIFGHCSSRVEKKTQDRGYSNPVEAIIGVSASHDASACLMIDGVTKYAVQLERLTRKKHDGVPYLHASDAINYCLNAGRLSRKDIRAFAFNIQALIPEYIGLSQPIADKGFKSFDPFDERAVFVSHHLAHAFAAFLSSPFEQATVFIADGSGGSTVESDDLILTGPEFGAYVNQKLTCKPALHVQSTYIFTRQSYQLVNREYAPSFNTRCGSSSLGEAYASASQYIFGHWNEGGKVMGLAPYGSADRYGPTLLERDCNGNLQFHARWKTGECQATGLKDPMAYKDLAARLQRDLEIALIDRFKNAIRKTGITNVVYSGGLALNSVANQKIATESGVTNLFILPASSDAGISIGSAAAANFKFHKAIASTSTYSDYLGYKYQDHDYEAAVEAYKPYIKVENASLDLIVEKLIAGNIIGWFEGQSEFGPRALGHRSILADPRSKDTWTYINKRVKFREDFRPFAPVVTEEDASKYFDVKGPCPYMLKVVPVRHKYRERLAAITHVDGSARIQTVSKSSHPSLHSLLKRFGEQSGVPILINTSLNVKGQPIVETPIEAIELLLSTHLDLLILAGKIIEPNDTVNLSSNKDLLVRFSPGMVLVGTSAASSFDARIVAELRGGKEYRIQAWLFQILSHISSGKNIGELVETYLSKEISEEEAFRTIQLLCDLGLLLTSRG